MQPFRRRFAGCALAVASLLAAATARATVMVEVPLEDMVRDADAIVLGVVERVGARLDFVEGVAEPHTVAFVRVRRWIKGEDPTDLVTIDEVGGVVGEMGLAIEGTPRYHVGEECIVFLRRIGARREYRTLQMAQGHFEILRGVPGTPDVVQRDLGAIGLASWASGEMRVEPGARRAMRLDDFLGFLETTLESLRVAAGPAGTVRGGGGR